VDNRFNSEWISRSPVRNPLYAPSAVIVAIILLAGCSWGDLSPPEEGQAGFGLCQDCNVLLISADTLGADHLGVYGYPRNTSPAIDTFSRQATVFADAQSPASYTLASQMSIFTSLYPHFHKMVFHGDAQVLDHRVSTLAELLEARGYRTAWLGLLDAESLDLARGFERGFKEFQACGLGAGCRDEGEDCWDPAMRWLDALGPGERFFISLISFKVHFPYVPAKDSLERFTNQTHPEIIFSLGELLNQTADSVVTRPELMFTPESIRDNKAIVENKSLLRTMLLANTYPSFVGPDAVHRDFCGALYETFWGGVNKTDRGDIAFVEALYDAEIFEFDQGFGRLIARLDERGLLNRTIIVLTSPHGEAFMEHGDVFHGTTLYNELIHVPLIIRVPGVWGIAIENPVELIDIVPTLLTLLGMEVPGHAQGVNLVPRMTGEALPGRRRYAEHEYHLKSVQEGDWKLISPLAVGGRDCLLRRGGGELYNLRNDPGEERNLIQSNPEVARWMEQMLVEDIARMEADLPEIPPLCNLK